MGACEPGQARDRAAISGNFHVPGFSLKAVFFLFLRLTRLFGSAAVLSCCFVPVSPSSPARFYSLLPLISSILTLYMKKIRLLSQKLAEFAKKSDKIAPRRLFYRVFRLK